MILLIIGAALIFFWGIAHLIPTRRVVESFGEISEESRQIITMEWIMEGLTLCFLGVLVALMAVFAPPPNTVSLIVDRAAAILLLLMATISLYTGAKTSVLPIKFCPAVKTLAAMLILIGSKWGVT